MSSDLQTVTVKATVSAINKKTFTRKRMTKSYQAVLKHTWVEDTKLSDPETLSSIACLLGVTECTIKVFQNQQRKETKDSRINKFHFAMMCLILQNEHPRVTSERIIRIVAGFLKESGDTYKTYLHTAVNEFISRQVAQIQQKDSCLSIGDCEGVVIYSFLWNIARFLGTA